MNNTKVCAKCKRELPANTEYFHKHNGFKDGLQSKCKECRSTKKERVIEKIEVNGELVNAKRCTKCGILKVASSSNFYKDSKGFLGLMANCKECQKEYKEENKGRISEYFKEYRVKNKEKLNEYDRQFRKENSEQVKQYSAEYYRENIDKINHYYKVNAEKVRKRKQKDRKENPDKYRLYNQRRRTLKKKAQANYTNEQWESCKLFF